MASSSHHSGKCPSFPPRISDPMDDVMKDIDKYKPDFKESMEKALTNLNVHIAAVSEQVEELNKSYQDFSAPFLKQQELLMEELRMLRIDSSEIRKQIAAYVDDDDSSD